MPLPQYSNSQTCCICALQLPAPSEKKQDYDNRQLECCSRFICGKCIDKNPRFAEYCPYCQTSSSRSRRRNSNNLNSSEPNHKPATTTFGVLPPTYTESDPSLPSYALPTTRLSSTPSTVGEITHYLHPTDTLSSLSLAYSVPLSLLRKKNLLFSDIILPGRRYILIPRTHYTGPSLSPTPTEDPETSFQKIKLKRFQLQTKCVEYKVAEWYLKETRWDLDQAVSMWAEDEEWEKGCLSTLHPQGQGQVRSEFSQRRHLHRDTTGASDFQRDQSGHRQQTRARKWGLRAFGY